MMFQRDPKSGNTRNYRVTKPDQPKRSGMGDKLRQWWQAKNADVPAVEVERDDDEVEVSETPAAGWMTALTWGMALLCLLIVALAVLNMHDFQTRVETGVASKFETLGAKRVTSQQVLLHSGVRWGSDLVAIDREAAARGIEKLPWVRHAEVRTQLPNKVTFLVQEYLPYALLLGDGKMMIVDANGHVFKRAELGEAGDLPVLTGFSTTLYREAHLQVAGEAPSGEQRRLRDVLRLIQAHATSPLSERFPLSEVHRDTVLGTTLVSAKDGAEIRLGKNLEADPLRAFALIGRVLDQAEKAGEWLRYALLDDELRPERIVVRTEKVSAKSALAGGAGAVPLPKEPTRSAKGAEGDDKDELNDD